MEKLIAYCGLDCAECGAFIARQNNDHALREKTAAEWTKLYHFSFTPEMINCVSCRGDGIHVGHCSVCEIRKCAAGKGVVNCGACGEFKTCKTINDFIAQAPSAKINLVQKVSVGRHRRLAVGHPLQGEKELFHYRGSRPLNEANYQFLA